MFEVIIQAAIGAKIIARSDGQGAPQERPRQVLRRRHHAKAEAPREAEGREEADEEGRPRRPPAGGLPRRPEGRLRGRWPAPARRSLPTEACGVRRGDPRRRPRRPLRQDVRRRGVTASRAARWSRHLLVGRPRRRRQVRLRRRTTGPGRGSCRTATSPRGDVVVFRYPADPSPRLREEGRRPAGRDGRDRARSGCFVDGRPARRARMSSTAIPTSVPNGPDVPRSVAVRDHCGPVTLAAGAFLALGDNRDDSQDSRFWGPVPRRHLKGRARLRLLVLRREPGRREIRGRGAALRRFLDNALHFFGRTRWGRTGLRSIP